MNFEHGVASGDPLQDRVILWTRLTPNDAVLVLQVSWEIVLLDNQFKQIIKTDKVLTIGRCKDFTVKVDVTGLKPDQSYFIVLSLATRFLLVGQTKTLPTSTSKSVLRYVHVQIIQQVISMFIGNGKTKCVMWSFI